MAPAGASADVEVVVDDEPCAGFQRDGSKLPGHGDHFDLLAHRLLANDDAAMYRAKEVGRDNFQFYTPQLNTKVHGKFLMQFPV